MRRKPASEAFEMRVSIVFGERSTQFLATSSGRDGVLKISQRAVEGKKETGCIRNRIAASNAHTRLPEVTDIPVSCYRAKMDIVMIRPHQPQEVKASCLGVEFPAEPPFRHFADLLAPPR